MSFLTLLLEYTDLSFREISISKSSSLTLLFPLNLTKFIVGFSFIIISRVLRSNETCIFENKFVLNNFFKISLPNSSE